MKPRVTPAPREPITRIRHQRAKTPPALRPPAAIGTNHGAARPPAASLIAAFLRTTESRKEGALALPPAPLTYPLMNLPVLNSCSATMISSSVFITKGP